MSSRGLIRDCTTSPINRFACGTSKKIIDHIILIEVKLHGYCIVRFCSFEGANENVWHILDVSASSPAELAGLRQYSDYIIGGLNEDGTAHTITLPNKYSRNWPDTVMIMLELFKLQ